MEWEDVFVSFLGLGWRAFRDNFQTQAQRMSNSNYFVNEVCRKWCLPVLDVTQDACMNTGIHEPVPKRKCTGLRRLEDRPDSAMELSTFDWQQSRKRFSFIVDFHAVQTTVCRHTPLLARELFSMFTKILDRVAAVMDEDWLPPQEWGDPITWRRRGRNTVADYLANWTMD